MMDVEFDSASRRFSKERQAERQRDAARKKREQVERAKARAQQAEWDANAELRRKEAAERAAEEARIFQHDLEANRGVAFSRRLRPVLSVAAEAKGIVRRADKISLPYSAKAELEEQQASKNGQLFFELSTAAGRRTHAASLDFTAPEGTVGAPAELLRCLGLSHLASPEAAAASEAEAVMVRYRRLVQGTHARLQPLRHAFHDVPDVKALLEEQLQRRATLTEGDEVSVVERLAEEGGDVAGVVEHVLRVLEVGTTAGGAWEGAVTLIDTDLEVELAPSVEREEEVAAQEAERRRREAALEEAAARRRAAEAAALADAEVAAAREAEAAGARLRAREARRAEAEAALAAAPEAEGGAAGAVQCVIRCPDGSRCVRRLRATDGVALLFALVEARYREPPDAPPLPDAFRLAAQFPRRELARPAAGAAGPSLGEAGLSSAQESLVVELPQHE